MADMNYQTRVSVAASKSTTVAFALAQVGKEYEFKAAGPNEYDCSGLVLAAERQRGLILPHNSSMQVEYFRDHHALAGVSAGRQYLVPGDVIFYYGSIKNPGSVSHCALYVGRSPTGLYVVVAAVDEYYGVKKHRMRWALRECGYGYAHQIGV